MKKRVLNFVNRKERKRLKKLDQQRKLLSSPFPEFVKMLTNLSTERGHTRLSIAHVLGINFQHLWRLERGITKIKPEFIDTLSDHYNLDADYWHLYFGYIPTAYLGACRRHPEYVAEAFKLLFKKS